MWTFWWPRAVLMARIHSLRRPDETERLLVAPDANLPSLLRWQRHPEMTVREPCRVAGTANAMEYRTNRCHRHSPCLFSPVLQLGQQLSQLI